MNSSRTRTGNGVSLARKVSSGVTDISRSSDMRWEALREERGWRVRGLGRFCRVCRTAATKAYSENRQEFTPTAK